MREALILLLVGCGGPQQPVLANAPRPDPAVIAGGAAAAAAAMTLADPNAATRGKPEKPADTEEKKPIDVKENVPPDVFDRLDHAGSAAGSGSAAAPVTAKPATQRKGPPPKIPSPRDAVRDRE